VDGFYIPYIPYIPQITMTPGHFHCWRLENILEDGFVVIEPSNDFPPYMLHQWDYLET
jgi:hypothetical protein